ncbi:hypothetical protein ACFL0D_09250 [Thermoproteota archaeon]
MAEALLNYWTLAHFLFGIGTSILIALLLRSKYRIVTISFTFILLWEAFEFRNTTFHWVYNYGNNVVDVIIGFIGILLGIKVSNFLLNEKSR